MNNQESSLGNFMIELENTFHKGKNLISKLKINVTFQFSYEYLAQAA